MRRTMVSIACCLVLFAPVFVAQEVGDPVTGSWGRNGLTYLELKFDGTSTVSGTAIWRDRDGDYEHRAPIKTGTFDMKTGALKLEGEAKTPDGVMAPFQIQGKIDKGTVAGTFRFGERSGEFSFTKL